MGVYSAPCAMCGQLSSVLPITPDGNAHAAGPHAHPHWFESSMAFDIHRPLTNPHGEIDELRAFWSFVRREFGLSNAEECLAAALGPAPAPHGPRPPTQAEKNKKKAQRKAQRASRRKSR